MADNPKPTASPVAAALRGRCPSCGDGRLFAGFLAVASRCEACRLDFGFVDTGDGPAVFIVLAVGFVVVGAALLAEAFYQPPYWLHFALWLPLAAGLCIGLLRPFKAVMLALQFKHKAEEGRLADK